MTPERRKEIEAFSARLHGMSTGNSMVADVIDECLAEIDRLSTPITITTGVTNATVTPQTCAMCGGHGGMWYKTDWVGCWYCDGRGFLYLS